MRMSPERFAGALRLASLLLTVPSPVYADCEFGEPAYVAMPSGEVWTRPSGYRVEQLPLLQQSASALRSELQIHCALVALLRDSTSEAAGTYVAQLQQVLPDDREATDYERLLERSEFMRLNQALAAFHERLTATRAAFLGATTDFNEWLAAARLVAPGEELRVPARFVKTGPPAVAHAVDLDQATLIARLSAAVERSAG